MANGYDKVERFGKARHDWHKQFLEQPHGIPGHDTLNRLLTALAQDRFSVCLARWMAGQCAAITWRAIANQVKAHRSAPADTFNGYLHRMNA